MHPWILALIVLASSPDSPRDRFDEVASAIEYAAGGSPILASELVALAARESRFDPEAVGYDAFGESYGLFQIHETNLPPKCECCTLQAWKVVFVPWAAALIAVKMVEKSHEVCSRRPYEEQLGWYASGGPGCSVPEGLAASRNRMRLAEWLLAKRPPFWSSGRVEVDVLPKRPQK
jgi:hypothetical protein